MLEFSLLTQLQCGQTVSVVSNMQILHCGIWTRLVFAFHTEIPNGFVSITIPISGSGAAYMRVAQFDYPTIAGYTNLYA